MSSSHDIAYKISITDVEGGLLHTILFQLFLGVFTCLEPLPWLYITMPTLIENWISKGGMLVDDVAQK